MKYPIENNYYLIKYPIMFFILLTLGIQVNAQEIKGKVTNPEGDFLFGIIVLELGTDNYVKTDSDGKFNIKLKNSSSTLEFISDKYVKNRYQNLSSTIHYNVVMHPKRVEISVPPDTWKRVQRREFSRFHTGSTFTDFGNYGSLSTASNTLKLNFRAIPNSDKPVVLGFEAAGGANEGVLALLNDQTVSNNLSFGFSYHKLIEKNSEVGIRGEEPIKINKKITEIQNKQYTYLYDLNEELSLKQDELHKLKTGIQKNSGIIQKNLVTINLAATTTDERIKLKSDNQSLQNQNIINSRKIPTVQAEIDTLIQKINTYKLDPSIKKGEWREEIRNERNKYYDVAAGSVRLNWWSVGIRARKNSFQLFDSQALTGRQLTDTSFVEQTIQIGLSGYNNPLEKNKQNSFWSLSLNIDYMSNFSSLNQVSLESQSTSGDFTKKNTITAYEGDFEKGIGQATLQYDRYQSLDNVAFHFNPEVSIGNEDVPITDALIGIYLPIRQQDKPKTPIAHIELFYEFNDVFENTLDSSNRRNDLLGLRGIFNTFNIKNLK